MQIDPCPFLALSFDQLNKEVMPGETDAIARFSQANGGGIRMRVVDYEPGFLLDHWCDVGHFGYVLSGELIVELAGKPTQRLSTGEGFLVSTLGDVAHRVSTDSGARVLLLD